MSNKGDFLSGFSGGNKQKPLTEENSKPVKDDKPSPEKAEPKKADIADNIKLADKIAAETEKKQVNTVPKPATTSAQKPTTTSTATRPAQNASAIIKAPEHVVTKDETFHKRKIIKYGIIGVVVVAVAIIGFFIFRMFNTVEVPNFVGREIEDQFVRAWQINSGPINTEEEYCIIHPAGVITSQDREAGTTMQSGSAINVTVSRGPDMNEIIPLPDFETMTRAQVRSWSDENRMRSVNFSDENHPDIEQNHVIRAEFASTADPDNFRRNDTVTIIISSGPETVQISNLVGDDAQKVAEFIADNPNIYVELEYDPHPTIERGTVLRQSVNPGQRIALGETLVLTVSAGQPVEVPNFADMRRSEAKSMEGDPTTELEVTVEGRWDANIPYGRFISQSVEPGTELFGNDRSVTVIYSLGRPWIPRFADERDAETQIFALNDQGSSLTVRFNRINSYEERGTILNQSHYNQSVPLNQEIVIDISLGNLTRPVETMPPMMPPGSEGDD